MFGKNYLPLENPLLICRRTILAAGAIRPFAVEKFRPFALTTMEFVIFSVASNLQRLITGLKNDQIRPRTAAPPVENLIMTTTLHPRTFLQSDIPKSVSRIMTRLLIALTMASGAIADSKNLRPMALSVDADNAQTDLVSMVEALNRLSEYNEHLMPGSSTQEPRIVRVGGASTIEWIELRPASTRQSTMTDKTPSEIERAGTHYQF